MNELIYGIAMFVFAISILAFMLGLIKPSLFKFLGSKATRKHIAFYSVGLFLISAIISGAFEPASLKQARLDRENQAKIAEQQKRESELKQQEELERQKQEAEQAEQDKLEAEKRKANALYEVTSIVDGDTIKVLIDNKTETIRLVGIDTPEAISAEPQCYAAEASAAVNAMLEGKQVRMENDDKQGDHDKYGRLLRFVFLEDGTHINEKIVKDGLGFEKLYASPHKYYDQFVNAQNDAKNAKRGLWSPDTCSGEYAKPQVQPAQTNAPAPAPAPAPKPVAPAPAPAPSSGGVVKKSSTGICHAPGTTYYDRTTNYTAYNSIDVCLASDGRLPKR